MERIRLLKNDNYEHVYFIVNESEMEIQIISYESKFKCSDLLGLYNLLAENYNNYKISFENKLSIKMYSIKKCEISHADIDNEELNMKSLEYGFDCDGYTTGPCDLVCASN